MPDYETIGIGAGDGALASRPALYTPIRVPVLDEFTTRQLRQQAHYAIQEAEQAGEPVDDLIRPGDIDAVYHWPYRPEMQFSIYDLVVQEINVTTVDDAGDLESEDHISSGSTTITSNTVGLEIIYDLLQGQFGPLPLIGEESELIFSVEGNEVVATIGDDQKVVLSNLDNLGSADPVLTDLNPSDLLTISIFQNSDPENVLWEWAFQFIRMVTDMNHDGRVITLTSMKIGIKIPFESAGVGV